MAESRYPITVEDLSCEWLTEILQKSGNNGDVTVKAFSTEPVGEPGQSSEVVRILLDYGRETANVPGSLIGKFPAKYDESRQLAVVMNTYLREVNFFKYVADSAKGLVPRCYAAEICLETHDFVLILEDVAHLRMGEWYVSRPEDSRLMLNKLAPFHARWWNSPDLAAINWISQPGKPDFDAWINQLKQLFAGVLPLVKEQYETYMSANAWATREKWLHHWDELWEDIRLNALWTSFVYILTVFQTDNEIFKAYAEERGKDPYEALLSWPGSGLDDWEVSKAIDRYLERARSSKKAIS